MDEPKNHLRSDGMRPPSGMLLSLTSRLIDVSLVTLSLVVPAKIYRVHWDDRFTVAVGLAVVAFQTAAILSGLYRSWHGTKKSDEATAVLGTWLGTVPVLLLAAFLTKTTDHFSRVVMTAWLVGAPLSVVLYRMMVRGLTRVFYKRSTSAQRIVIAGATESGLALSKRLSAQSDLGSKVLGIYDDRSPVRLKEKNLNPKRLLGNLRTLLEDARSGKVDVIYIALPLRAERRIQDLVSALADTTATVYVVTDLFMFDLMNARWGTVADMPVVSVFDTPFHGLGGWVKRAEDIFLSGVILCLIALPMAAIAIAVKTTSKGPIFFKQTRYGLKGRPIKVFKFRSMTTCDDGNVVVQAQKNDKRITPLGAFLRRTSLDELPQFLNVFTGEMSVVGPRPHAVAHNELYRPQIRGYMLRHKVKPGITGWAQVNGWRGETEAVEKMEQRVEHDLFYIDNWSLFWDLKIVFLTVFGRKVRSNAV